MTAKNQITIGVIVLLAVVAYRAPEIIKAARGPVAPVGPAPIAPTDLAALVPDAAHRAKLAGFYRDFGAAVQSGALSTTGQFREAQKIAAAIVKKTAQLPEAPQIQEPISNWIAGQVGLEDKQLDSDTRTSLANALFALSKQFGAE